MKMHGKLKKKKKSLSTLSKNISVCFGVFLKCRSTMRVNTFVTGGLKTRFCKLFIM